MRFVLAILVIMTLCACGTVRRELPAKLVTEDRPVPISCVPKDSPEAPAYADSTEALKAAMDFGVRDGLVKGEWAKHRAREAYLEELRRICMGAAVR